MNAGNVAVDVDLARLGVDAVAILGRQRHPGQPGQPDVVEHRGPFEVLLVAGLQVQADDGVEDVLVARLDRPDRERRPRVRLADLRGPIAGQSMPLPVQERQREERPIVMEMLGLEFALEHVAVEPSDGDQGAVRDGPGSVEIDPETAVAGGRGLIADLDADVVRIARPGPPRPTVRPTVVVLVPRAVERTMEDGGCPGVIPRGRREGRIAKINRGRRDMAVRGLGFERRTNVPCAPYHIQGASPTNTLSTTGHWTAAAAPAHHFFYRPLILPTLSEERRPLRPETSDWSRFVCGILPSLIS